MAASKEKKRLTLTGNKMPEDVYLKLDELGATRRLTPYIVSLIQKEETMDKLISNLSTLITKITNLEELVSDLNYKIEQSELKIMHPSPAFEQDPGVIEQGELDISDKIIGGIKEEIEDTDF